MGSSLQALLYFLLNFSINIKLLLKIKPVKGVWGAVGGGNFSQEKFEAQMTSLVNDAKHLRKKYY